jgi:hypothetical protein
MGGEWRVKGGGQKTAATQLFSRHPSPTAHHLRFQMRLAKDLQCLKVESYGFAAKAIDELGKLVGGWIKSSGSAAESGGCRRSMRRDGLPLPTKKRCQACSVENPQLRSK